VSTTLTAVLAIAVTVVAAVLVREAEQEVRTRLALGPACPLTRCVVVVGTLALVAALAPPPAASVVGDVSARVGGVLLAEGVTLIAGVVLLARRPQLPAAGIPSPRAPEDPR
jgi:hypothetical protein